MMGIAYVPARICAVCVKSEATETTIIDGRTYHVCAECGDGGGVVRVDGYQWRTPSRDEIMTAIAASPGVASSTLAADLLDVDDADDSERRRAMNAFSMLVTRMAERGEIIRKMNGSGRGSSGSRLWPARVP